MTAPDRLSLIESRWREAGCGDGDTAWLLEEVKRLRTDVRRLKKELQQVIATALEEDI